MVGTGRRTGDRWHRRPARPVDGRVYEAGEDVRGSDPVVEAYYEHRIIATASRRTRDDGVKRMARDNPARLLGVT